MTDNESERRQLAAIMVTDMVGYSAATEADEEKALRLLNEQANLIRPLIRKHKGTEIKSLGDGFLVMFASANDAATCAVEIQQSLKARNDSSPADGPIFIRIGLHAGDIIVKENDVFGEGVNIAARLEPLAVPGGVCLSESVARLLGKQFPFPVVPAGERKLKNIEATIQVHGIGFPWIDSGRIVKDAPANATRIAVLPFRMLSSGGTDYNIAEALTDELIATLSRIRDLRVIARTSILRYAAGERDPSKVDSDLNVKIVVDGSVRVSGGRCRISVSAIATDSGQAIWSEHYDRDLQNILSLESEIAIKIAGALRIRIAQTDEDSIRKSGTSSPEAFREYLAGMQFLNQRTPASMERAGARFERAIQLDPKYAKAYAAAAEVFMLQAVGFSKKHRDELVAKAKECAEKSLELDPASGEAYGVLAYLSFRFEWNWERAEQAFRKAIELNPSNARIHESYALFLAIMNRNEEAIEQMERAVELDTLSPSVQAGLGRILDMVGRPDEAVRQLKTTIEQNPDYAEAYFSLGMAYASLGEMDEGLASVRRAIELKAERPIILAVLALMLNKIGKRDDANAIAEQLLKRSETTYVHELVLFETLWAAGRIEEAMEYARRGYASRDPFLVFFLNEGSVNLSFDFSPLRDILEKMRAGAR